MSPITTDLAEILSTIKRPGNFYTSGTTETFAPHLEVEGVGTIALPLLPIQVEQLVAVAEQAPYGRGEETLVDPDVRRTWQINADKVRIEGRHWPQTLESIVSRAAEGLGVTDMVNAELYKLLVYEEGCFFVDHRDTEKAPGMFATLVIVLPSLYTGGELLVRHRDHEAHLDLSCSDPSEVSFAAFYADCVHEILPITSGCRLTLVYNLVRSGKGKLPEPPGYEAEQTRLVELLQQWVSGKKLPDDDTPEKLIYPLEHAYTPAALAFDALKGADAATANVLVGAAKEAECDLHLALVSIRESGEAENNDYYGSRRSRWRSWDDDEDEGDFEVGEVYSRNATLSEWRRPDGNLTDMGSSPFEEKELCPPDAFDGLEPDELHFQEATGNEGASFDRTYQRAGLILWPSTRRLAVLNQAGLAVTLPYLGELTQYWVEDGEDPESSLWQEAHELAGHMLRTWPQKDWRYDAKGATSQMLTLLNQLWDVTSIDSFLCDLSATGVYDEGDNEALIQATSLLSPERSAELIERIIAGNIEQALGACCDLLARAMEAAQDGDCTADLIPAAALLVEALPGDPNNAKVAPWHRRSVEPEVIVNLLSALGHLNTPLADQAVKHMLAWPKTYELDTVLVPAVLTLSTRAEIQTNNAFQCLRAACLDHLHTRIAEPLEPFQDWTRDGTLSCKCKHCSELSLFLCAPDQNSWTFKAAEALRGHVQSSGRQNNCDLDYQTERRGSPYRLICTKNQASYERRVRQRNKDLEDLAKIEVPLKKVRRPK